MEGWGGTAWRIVRLSRMVETLEAKSGAIEERLADVEARILDVQEGLQTIRGGAVEAGADRGAEWHSAWTKR